jgi:D-alanyl-D-alanine carboxypeptidase/D-alanyl-D-alanine-endopeptidase (penicillin-binding protein 4)
VALLVLVLVTGGVATVRYDLADRWLDDAPAPRTPAAIPPPPGLDLPALSAPPRVADPLTTSNAGDPAAAAVRRALAGLLDDPDLGKHVVAAVSALGGGAPVLTHGSGQAIPASTTKLVTMSAALMALGPDATFETRVVNDGRDAISLVGGGDPYLASRPERSGEDPAYPHRADVVTLARATAAALQKAGRTRVRLGYDDTLFSGPAVNPHWPDDYIPDGVVSPITALWVDEGRPASGSGRVADPSLSAATVFAGALARAGIEVVGIPEPRPAKTGARVLASVSSAPLDQIVERVLGVSDNEAAEVLFRQVAVATDAAGSSEGARRGVRQVLETHGIALRGSVLYDGSGLSREDRIDPRLLIDVLRAAASSRNPELRPVLTGLPVAGFTGSLAYRFDAGDPRGRGRVRAKTGTLTGVSGLAGLANDLDGEVLVFVLFADKVALQDTLKAREALDDAAAALGACHCSR